MKKMLEELCIEVTGQCLMNCLHCSSSCSADNQDFLSFEKVQSILKDANNIGAKVIDAYQLKRFKELVVFVSRNVPFYKKYSGIVNPTISLFLIV